MPMVDLLADKEREDLELKKRVVMAGLREVPEWGELKSTHMEDTPEVRELQVLILMEDPVEAQVRGLMGL